MSGDSHTPGLRWRSCIRNVSHLPFRLAARPKQKRLAMRYCRRCGTPLPLEARFCDECGTPVGAIASPAAPSAPPLGNTAPSSAPTPEASIKSGSRAKSSRGLPPWLIVCSVLVVAVAATGIGSYLNSRCQADGCSQEAVIGNYCISHVCLHKDCTYQRSKYSDR